MSKDHQPTHPTTLPQIAGVFGSLTQATNEILGGNPVFLDEVRNIYTSFLTSPTTIKILGYKPTAPHPQNQPSDSLRKEILDIKATISTLCKSMQGAKSPSGKAPATTPPKTPPTQGVPIKPPPPTYASKTSARARPSVVVDLEKHQIADRPHLSVICSAINEGLKTYPDVCQARVSAARWTACGNLVITAGPNTSEKLLNFAILYIALITKKALKLQINASTPTRANVRWSRILINRVPTGATAETEAHNPVSCHQSLMADNLSPARDTRLEASLCEDLVA